MSLNIWSCADIVKLFLPIFFFTSLFRVAGHPLAQNEKCLHMFLQEPVIDKNYVPGKIRTT